MSRYWDKPLLGGPNWYAVRPSIVQKNAPERFYMDQEEVPADIKSPKARCGFAPLPLDENEPVVWEGDYA